MAKPLLGEPPKIEFVDEAKISVSGKPPPRGRWHNIVLNIKDALLPMFRDWERGGYLIEIDVDSIREMAVTLDKFGGALFKGTLEKKGPGILEFVEETLHDVVHFAYDGVHREIFDTIGTSAKEHMRRVAYKTPEERRGGALKRHLRGKSPADAYAEGKYDPLSWVVGLWTGPHQRFRTGWLQDSITYKVIMHTEKSKRKSKVATKMYVGPGAGKTPAPPYAQLVNEGRGPTYGIHYVPRDRKGKPRMARGGVWMGYEGKHYMEETAEWLVRSTPKMQWNSAQFARIHVRRAIKEYKDSMQDQLRKGIGFDFSDELVRDIERLVTIWLEETSKTSTKKIIHKIHEILSRGEL